MKNAGKRILMLIHWLLSLLICAALAVCVIAPGFVASICNGLRAAIGPVWMWVVGIVLLLIYAALAALQLMLILGRRRHDERGFITVDSGDDSRVRIAVSALEQMVRQSVRNIDGITDMKIDIESQDDAIDIGINASIASGSHVPTLTSNIQRSVRQYVEINCGVSVHMVSVSIDAVTGQPEGSHRRRLGWTKQAAAPQPIPDEVPKTVPENNETAPKAFEEAPESVETLPETPAVDSEEGFEAPAEPDERVEAPAYDFDKPYESEFEKDLAALKNKAESENGESDGSKDIGQL